jgi:hypothetical protein
VKFLPVRSSLCLKKTTAVALAGTLLFTLALSASLYAQVAGSSLTITPPNLTFTSAVNQPSISQSVTVTNTAAATATTTVTISSVALTGPNAADYSVTGTCVGASLTNGQSCVESVIFTPQSLGPSNATLVLTDSESTPPPSVALFGTGLAAIVQLTPALINTFAGTGKAGYTGDGGPSTAAQINDPANAVVDAAGNLFFADRGNNVIRKIDANGTITTFAGNGTSGSTGDDGPATRAQLNHPDDIAFDVAGNAYIADTANNTIRKVDGQGIITVFAGTAVAGFSGDDGPATAAQLNGPSGVATDSQGNVYIADSNNNRIRVVNAQGNITTFAGTGTAGYTGDNGGASSATLNQPFAVRVGAVNDVYIADRGNHVIRLVNIDFVISTVAGNGIAGLSGDGGPATSAQLNDPVGLGGDAASELFIADFANNDVRKIDLAGVISTVAGAGTAGYTGDKGPATLATLHGPNGVAADTAGNLFIPDDLNNAVRKVSSGTGVLAFLPTLVGQSSAAQVIGLTNIGNAPLTLPPLAQWIPTGPASDYQVTGPCTTGITLGANGTCSIQVIFAPTAAGDRTLTYTIPDNALGGSQLLQFIGAGLQSQTITFPPIPNHASTDPPFALVATASSGLPVTFTVISGPATVSGNIVTLIGTGSVTIQADQPGNNTFAAAPSVQQTFSVTALAPPQIVLSGPSTASSGQQPILVFQLVNPYPVPLIGNFALAFQPDPKAGVDDPSVQFAGGGRAFNFGIPANSTITPTVQLQTGTIAGTIVITLQVNANGVNVTPGNLAPVVINIPEAVPSLISATTARNGDTITVSIQGFSNTREVTTAKFHFAGETFKNPDITIDVTSLFANWYSNESSLQFGSSFTYTQSFTLSSSALKVKTITVTLDNSVGTSAAVVVQ